MYVCVCNAITDSKIKHAVLNEGVGNMRELKDQLSIANQCGKCAQLAQDIIDQTIVDDSLFREVS